MAKEELLDGEHWRIFRLFLCDLSDEEMEGVKKELEKERAARRERENSIVRLFYSTMCDCDLEAAAGQLRVERKARAGDRGLARQSACDKASRANTATGKTRRRASRSPRLSR